MASDNQDNQYDISHDEHGLTLRFAAADTPAAEDVQPRPVDEADLVALARRS